MGIIRPSGASAHKTAGWALRFSFRCNSQ